MRLLNILLSLLVVLILPYALFGIKVEFNREGSGRFIKTMLSGFGLARGAYFNAETSITASSSSSQSSVLLLLVNNYQLDLFYAGGSQDTMPTAANANILCASPSVARFDVGYGESTFSASIPATDRYAALLLECNIGNETAPIVYDVTVSAANRGFEGEDILNHYPIERVMIIQLYLGLAIFYGILAGVVVVQGLSVPFYCINKLHVSILALLCFFCFSCTTAYQYSSQVNETGESTDSTTIAIRSLSHVCEWILNMLAILIALGWTTTRNDLTRREILTIIPWMGLYLVSGLLSAQCMSTEDSDVCLSMYTVVSFCRPFVILTLVFIGNMTLSRLRVNVTNSIWGPTMPKAYWDLQRYYDMYVIFFIYVVTPVVFIIITLSLLDWQYGWVAQIIQQLPVMMFVTYIVVLFGPSDASHIDRAFAHRPIGQGQG